MMTAPARTEIRFIRCTFRMKTGRICNHLISTVRGDQWEAQRVLDTTIECKRCNNVFRLADFM